MRFIMLAVVLATASTVVAQRPDAAVLVKEVADLIDARREAVRTVHIVADRLSLANENVHPLTPEQVRVALLQYGATSGTQTDRDELRRTLSPLRAPALALTDSVEFSSEGVRTAERSTYLRPERYVTDERATVRSIGQNGQRVQTSIWEPHRSNFYNHTLSSFSSELRMKAADIGVFKLLSAGIDEAGHFVATWKENGEEGSMEFSQEDGILRSWRSSSKGHESLTIQAGRLRTWDGIPFPAVNGHFRFREGKLHSLQLVAPKSVEANQPIAPEVFRVAAARGSTIMDYRDQPAARRSVPQDVDDIVELANSLRKPQNAQPAQATKP